MIKVLKVKIKMFNVINFFFGYLLLIKHSLDLKLIPWTKIEIKQSPTIPNGLFIDYYVECTCFIYITKLYFLHSIFKKTMIDYSFYTFP